MVKNRQQEDWEIQNIISQNPQGIGRGTLSKLLNFSIKNKTLQRRLQDLTQAGLIVKKGDRRTTLYYPKSVDKQEILETEPSINKDKRHPIYSKNSQEILKYLDTPMYSRPTKSYNRTFLENYVPNETIYIPMDLRTIMHQTGRRTSSTLAAGTYARQICQRLLIDLAFNSSRLEGNTYSELDTKRLVEEGIHAEGKVNEETVMIINHKEAILFLVTNAQDIEPSAFTIYNLHHLLSQDLLANPNACGKIRQLSVKIEKSSYIPLDNPHQLQEYLELALLKARQITDPFEQSFFLLTHLSYLQAFEDVNKRTARLACNIPLIKNNLCPLSFTELPRDDYLAAMLTLYETNNLLPMLELYQWAYLRSCEQYDSVKQSLGELDAFRIKYRQQRKEVMGQVIRAGLQGKELELSLKTYCSNKNIENSEKFIAMTLADLSNLHEGAIIGLGITQKQFQAWKEHFVIF